MTLSSPRVTQPSVTISYLAPSYRTSQDGEVYALQVLSEILGGGATSRLYSRLVVDRGVANSAGSSYGGDDYDMSTFRFYGSPRQGQGIETVQEALHAEIRKVLDEGVTDEEVAAAKKRLAAGAIFARDPLSAPPRIIGGALTTGRTIEEVEAWPDNIRAVTRAQVNAAAKKVFNEKQSVTGILLPEPAS